MEESNTSSTKNQEISLVELIKTIRIYWNYLLSKWVIILIFGLSGGAIGLVASFLIKPKYTAHLSFSLVEKSAGGGLADLASSFGLSGLGGGSGSAFSGDNLLEIIQSRYAIEKTLLTPVQYKGKTKNLVEVYIEFSELREAWLKNNKKPELQRLSFPVGQKRETYTRTQDSVLYCVYNSIVGSKSLSVIRKDKKVSIVNIDFVSKDEVFSKLFVEQLMNQTYIFYKETKTSQSRINIKMMQHTADSIKALYEGSLFKSAGYSQVNINPALQFAAVPKIKNENNAQLYAAVYGEALKNLETIKLDMARETPIVQIIDTPRYPLKVDRFGKAKGFVYGGLFGGMTIIICLLSLFYFRQIRIQSFQQDKTK